MPYVINPYPIEHYIQPAISFSEAEHRYFNAKGEEYRGVSSVLKGLAQPFEEKDAYKKADEATKKQWKETGREASTKGKLIHTALENDWDDKPIPESVLQHTNHIKAVNEKYKSYYAVYNEVILYNHEYKLCGTADRIMFLRNGTVEIMDFKSNAKRDKKGNVRGITVFNEYNNTYYPPFEHFDDCDYVKYSFQLSFYAYMFEKLTGKRVRRTYIHWINADNPAEDRIFPTLYLKHEVETVLKRMKNSEEPQIQELF